MKYQVHYKVPRNGGQSAVVPFGLVTDGRCNIPDTDDGVTVPEDGVLCNFLVESSGTRTNDQSGRAEFYVDGQLVHTITLGLSPKKEDTQKTVNVLKGQKVKVRYWQQAGDNEFNLKVGIGFGFSSSS